MIDSESNVSATVDFAGSDTVTIQEDGHAKPNGFYQGATWSLQRLAAWLDKTTFVSNDEASQQAVDNTKKLIAEQARQAADHLRPARQKSRT